MPKIRQPQDLQPKQRQIHLVEVKYCEDTRPKKQLEANTQQHSEPCKHLQGARVNLHTILLGVGGVIYVPHILEPLKQLCIIDQRAKKLKLKTSYPFCPVRLQAC